MWCSAMSNCRTAAAWAAASRIKEAAPAVEVILMTAYGNIPDGVQAIKNGF